MTDLLTANPKIDAVFAINDPTGIGCDLAAKQAKRNEFFIVGVDGSPDAVAALKQKGSLFEATPAQDPYAMAEKAVEVGAEVMGGKKPAEKDTSSSQPSSSLAIMSTSTKAGPSSPPGQPILTVRGVTKSFPGVRALKGVDLTI